MALWNTTDGFLNSTINHSYDMDGMYGMQCWDYGDYFWLKQVNRDLSTGGTGKAKGCWENLEARKKNAGSQFQLITDKNELQVGDWIVFGSGEFGHIGCIYSIIDKGRTVCLQSQNQGTFRTRVTRVNWSLTSFLGAFRYKKWEKGSSFLPEKGYWKIGDTDKRIDTLCEFYANNFYGYFCKTKQQAMALLDGSYFGKNCQKWTKEFQKRTNLTSDGMVGPITYDKLKQFGFKG